MVALRRGPLPGVFLAKILVDVESKSSGSAAPDVWVNLAISRFPPSG